MATPAKHLPTAPRRSNASTERTENVTDVLAENSHASDLLRKMLPESPTAR